LRSELPAWSSLLGEAKMIGNCFSFKKDDNKKMNKNASFFWFCLKNF